MYVMRKTHLWHKNASDLNKTSKSPPEGGKNHDTLPDDSSTIILP